MRVLLFLNELSCASDAGPAAVDDGMTEFVGLLRHVRGLREQTALVTEASLRDLEPAKGYYVQQWIGRRPRNKDEWRYIQSTRNISPVRAVLPMGATDGVDYLHQGRAAEALGGAHLLDGLAVSLPLEQIWRESWITAERHQLVEGDDGDVQLDEDEVDVRHAWCRGEVGCHEEWITSAGLAGLVSGAELWEARTDFFPHLRFLPQVERQLAELDIGWLRGARDELLRLEEAIAEWDPAQCREPSWRSHVTPESQTRKHLCEFEDLDGVVRTFSLHARFTPGAGRLHFRLVPAERAATVAHIGRKLGV